VRGRACLRLLRCQEWPLAWKEFLSGNMKESLTEYQKFVDEIPLRQATIDDWPVEIVLGSIQNHACTARSIRSSRSLRIGKSESGRRDECGCEQGEAILRRRKSV